VSEQPPDAAKWWRHRRYQSYLGIAGLLALSIVAVGGNVDDAAAALLEYAGIGCAALAVQYSLSASLCDAVRAWKGDG
jgi:hypothetical protein